MPKESEVAFCCCSYLPSYHGAVNVPYSRINIKWQKVFSILIGQNIRFKPN